MMFVSDSTVLDARVGVGTSNRLQALFHRQAGCNVATESVCLLVIEHARLVLEQPFLAVEAAAVSGQGPIGADHAMAGNDDARWGCGRWRLRPRATPRDARSAGRARRS